MKMNLCSFLRLCALCVLCGAPSVAFAGDVDLTWADNSTNESGFRLERSSGAGAFVQIAQTAANVTTYADTNIAPGTYAYRVRAYNSAGQSAYSNTATVVVPTPETIPNPPGLLRGTVRTTVAAASDGSLSATVVLTTPSGSESATVEGALAIERPAPPQPTPGPGRPRWWEKVIPKRTNAATPAALK